MLGLQIQKQHGKLKEIAWRQTKATMQSPSCIGEENTETNQSAQSQGRNYSAVRTLLPDFGEAGNGKNLMIGLKKHRNCNQSCQNKLNYNIGLYMQ